MEKKIYLFCNAGISTKFLKEKMQTEAKKLNISVIIEVYPFSRSFEVIKCDQPNCILLGPQVKFLLGDLVSICSEKRIPLDVIDCNDYGTMNGENVLKQALMMMKKK